MVYLKENIFINNFLKFDEKLLEFKMIVLGC